MPAIDRRDRNRARLERGQKAVGRDGGHRRIADEIEAAGGRSGNVGHGGGVAEPHHHLAAVTYSHRIGIGIELQQSRVRRPHGHGGRHHPAARQVELDDRRAGADAEDRSVRSDGGDILIARRNSKRTTVEGNRAAAVIARQSEGLCLSKLQRIRATNDPIVQAGERRHVDGNCRGAGAERGIIRLQGERRSTGEAAGRREDGGAATVD